MLKNTPRLITIGLILLFSLPLGIQHVMYALNQSHVIDTGHAGSAEGGATEAEAREAFTEKLSRGTETFRWLERLDYDLHLRWSDPGPMHGDVAIIEIGERSLIDLGQFPFSRTIYKQLLQRLERAGAKVLAFDATFPEHDSRNDLLTQLRQLRHQIEQKEGFDSAAVREIDERIFSIDADEDFATALHNSKLPVVLGFTFAANSSELIPVSKDVRELFLAYDVHRRNFLDAGSLHSYSLQTPVVSIVELMRSLNVGGSIGHINPDYGDDGLIRAIPAAIEYQGHVLASLALRAVAAYYGESPVLDGSKGLWIGGSVEDEKGERRVGKMSFPLNSDGTFMLRYYGKGRQFPYSEFSDVVKDRFTEAQLKEKFGGKIVFVGATAVGLKDLRATPLYGDYPGVETHATMASNVLSQHFLLRDQRYFLFGYLFLFLLGAVVSWVVYRFHPFFAFFTTVLGVTAVQLVTHLVFFNNGVVVPSILPSVSCLMIFFTGVLYRYFTEEREKKVVRAAFSRYVSSAVVEEILKDQTKLRLGGQKKELTLMFVDLVEFTKLSEHMDATFVTTLLNEYFTRMTNILLHNMGTLDKYMGDGLMCFWGAPLENPDHARLACLTALEMRAELARLNREWQLKHGITIESRIGVHTGVVAVGNMGSDQVFSYTVMGDNVNLGSRLEGVNTVYGTSIIVSAATAAKAGGDFLFRPLDRVQVKGKEDSVDILELVSPKTEKEPEWVHAFRAGLRHYQAGEWDDAESAFGACLSLKPGDGPCQVFIDRIRDFRIVAPDEWGGVWKLNSK